MAKATVRLIEGQTLSSRGRNFKRNQPQTITNKSDIEHFRSMSQFRVTDISESSPAPAPAPRVEVEGKKQKPVEAAPPVEAEEPVETAVEEDEDEIEILTREQLKSLTKKKLVKVGEERLVLLTGSESKDEMIDQIIQAQEQLQDEEDEEENE